jgi:hypothetical protein
MASKRAASISDCLSDVELAFFQAGMAGPVEAPLETHDEAPEAPRGFWSRLLGRLWR